MSRNRTSRLLHAISDDVQAIPDPDIQHSALQYQPAPTQPIAVATSSFATAIGNDDLKPDTFVTSSIEPNGGVKLSQTLADRPKSGVNLPRNDSSPTDINPELSGGVRLPPSDENLNEPDAKPLKEHHLLFTPDKLTAQETSNTSVSGGHPFLAASHQASTQLSGSTVLTDVTNPSRAKNLSNEQSSNIAFSVLDEDDDIQTVTSTQCSGSTLPAISVAKIMNCGDLASFSKGFCPIVSVSKFPYKFVPASVKQDVASQFFDGGKFWMREWDL
jgi:hypothetical protein